MRALRDFFLRVEQKLIDLVLGPDLKSRVEHSWIFFLVLFGTIVVVPWILIYAGPYSVFVQPKPIHSSRPPLVKKVLFIVIDGLGADPAYTPGWMPRLEKRRPSCAWGKAVANFPTLTPACLRTIFSGHPPLPRFLVPGGVKSKHEYDSVFSRATDAGLFSYVVGEEDWPIIFSGQPTQIRTITYQGHPPGYDVQVLKEGMKIFKNRRKPWNLLVLHLYDMDILSHQHGVGGPLYRKKLLWLDERIEKLSKRVLPEGCMIVTADHGHTKNGTHGGMEPEVRHIPFIMWGKGIKPGKLASFPQENIAPTLCVLLGLPPPANTDAMPVWDALQISERDRALAILDILEQRSRRWRSLKSTWPWLEDIPRMATREVGAAQEAQDDVRIYQVAEAAVKKMDRLLDSISPLQWMKNIVITLWLLLLSASSGLVWPLARRGSRAASAVLGSAVLGALVCTFALPSVWHMATQTAVICSGLMFLQMLVPGLVRTGMENHDWVIWWVAIFGVAFPNVIDTWIWSWIAVWLGITERYWDSSPRERRFLYIGFSVLVFTTLLASWSPGTDTSFIRRFIPVLKTRSFIHPNWSILLVATMTGLILTFWDRCRRIQQMDMKQKVYFFIAGVLPLVFADVNARWQGTHTAVFSWVVILISTVLTLNLLLFEEERGLFLSLMALAFFRTMSSELEFVFLGLASLVGWTFAWTRVAASPLRQGLVLNGLFLWSYMVTSGHMDFSHITVDEGYLVLGAHWLPTVLVGLLVLKHIAIVAAPTLPIFSEFPFRGLMSALLPMGALSAGCLTLLWFDYVVYQTSTGNLINDTLFAKALFVVILSCIMVLLWVAARIIKLGFKTAIVYEIT